MSRLPIMLAIAGAGAAMVSLAVSRFVHATPGRRSGPGGLFSPCEGSLGRTSV